MTDPETKLAALDSIDVDYLSEHFHAVRTASGRPHNRRQFTAVCRVDSDGELKEPRVHTHQTGSHVRAESDSVVLVFYIGGRPFMSRDEYKRRLREKIQRTKRMTEQQAERRQEYSQTHD